jgi:hypothetical protein
MILLKQGCCIGCMSIQQLNVQCVHLLSDECQGSYDVKMMHIFGQETSNMPDNNQLLQRDRCVDKFLNGGSVTLLCCLQLWFVSQGASPGFQCEAVLHRGCTADKCT